MARELLLARHGHAEPPDADDHARALTAGGRRAVERVGAHLRERGWLPSVALASSAVRARVTAELMLEAAGLADLGLAVDTRIYVAGVRDLVDILAGVDGGAGRVLLVGHNPAIERTVSLLAGLEASFLPGMLARLIMPDDWSALGPGSAALADVIRPDALAARR